jgi:hypothetical protein
MRTCMCAHLQGWVRLCAFVLCQTLCMLVPLSLTHSLTHRVPCVRTRQLVGPAPHLYTKLPRAVAPCAIHTRSRVSAWHTHKHPAPTRLHAIYLSLSLSHSLFRCEYVPHRSLKPVAGTRDVPVANCKKRQRSSSENSRTICSVRQKASKCVRV